MLSVVFKLVNLDGLEINVNAGLTVTLDISVMKQPICVLTGANQDGLEICATNVSKM